MDHRIGLDRSAATTSRGNEPELAAVTKSNSQTALLEALRQVHKHGVAVIGHGNFGVAGIHFVEYLSQSNSTVLHTTVIKIF